MSVRRVITIFPKPHLQHNACFDNIFPKDIPEPCDPQQPLEITFNRDCQRELCLLLDPDWVSLLSFSNTTLTVTDISSNQVVLKEKLELGHADSEYKEWQFLPIDGWPSNTTLQCTLFNGQQKGSKWIFCTGFSTLGPKSALKIH
jgi:hypothetical protein